MVFKRHRFVFLTARCGVDIINIYMIFININMNILIYLNILKTLNFDCKKPHISNHRYIIVFIRYIQIPPLLHLSKI